MQRATSKVNSNPVLPCVILPKMRINPKAKTFSVVSFIFVIKHSRFNWLLPLLNVLHFVGILNYLRTHPTGKQWFSLHYKILNTCILSNFNLYSAWIICALNQNDFTLFHSEKRRCFCMLLQCKCKVWRRMGSRSYATLVLSYYCFIHSPPTSLQL